MPTAVSSPAPFDALAESYDEVFTYSLVGRAQRESVWKEADGLFRPGQRILEINCGTGVDALRLAQRGVAVVACDSAPRMIAVARRRLEANTSRAPVAFQVLATEEIRQLENHGPFDGLLSNFGGLNCVEDLSAVSHGLARLVKPGGKALFCVMGPRCLWEVCWYLARADWRRAFRRFRRHGTLATLGSGTTMRVQYPSAGSLARALAPHFQLERWKGVGIVVPPSYLEFLAERFPRMFRAAATTDPWLGSLPVLRGLADHLLLTFERTQA